MKRLFYLITGGRPMKQTDSNSFRDTVSGKQVNYYKDHLGKKWMANTKWSLFRISANKEKSEMDKAIYRQSKTKYPYPLVKWVCDCGYQQAIMAGYNLNFNSDDYGKLVIPTGTCTKCKKEIEAIQGEPV